VVRCPYPTSIPESALQIATDDDQLKPQVLMLLQRAKHGSADAGRNHVAAA
jgi:hypothetical protein